MTCPHMRSSWQNCPYCRAANLRRQRALDHQGRIANVLIAIAVVLALILLFSTNNRGGCLDSNSCSPRTTTSLTVDR